MSSSLLDVDTDSDDSLPSVSDIFPSISPKEIEAGDIVYAKFKKLYWPALVRRVHKKEKKYTIWYTDDPGKNFKVSMKNVFEFGDYKKSREISEAAFNAGVGNAHDGLTTHAQLYLTRKHEGYDDNPKLFFDQTYPYLLMDDFFSKNPDVDKETFAGIRTKPLYIDNSKPAKIPKLRGKVSSKVTLNNDSDLEVSKEEESFEENAESDDQAKGQMLPKKSIFANAFIRQDDDYSKNIVDFILSGNADTYLSSVLAKKVKSVYYKFYLEAMKTDQTRLSCISYGPVTDMNKLRELTSYLSNFYDEVNSSKNKKSKAFSFPSTSGIQNSKFVTSVWLPEAIIYAISKLKKISLEQANKLFTQKSSVDVYNASNHVKSNDNKLDETYPKKYEINLCKKSLNSASSSQNSRGVLKDLCGKESIHMQKNVGTSLESYRSVAGTSNSQQLNYNVRITLSDIFDQYPFNLQQGETTFKIPDVTGTSTKKQGKVLTSRKKCPSQNSNGIELDTFYPEKSQSCGLSSSQKRHYSVGILNRNNKSMQMPKGNETSSEINHTVAGPSKEKKFKTLTGRKKQSSKSHDTQLYKFSPEKYDYSEKVKMSSTKSHSYALSPSQQLKYDVRVVLSDIFDEKTPFNLQRSQTTFKIDHVSSGPFTED